MLESLTKVIAELRSKAERHKALLSKSEAATRYALIDPLLRALGWPLDDPDWVQVEAQAGKGKADYLLLDGQGRAVLVLEAKALGGKLDLGNSAAVSYGWALNPRPRLVGVTDGLRWTVADPHSLKTPLLSLDLADPKRTPQELALGLAQALWRELWVVQEAVSPSPSPKPTPPPSSDLVPLEGLDPTRKKPPRALLLPDGQERPLKYWRDLLVQAARWAAETGRLRREDLPVPRNLKGKGAYIAHTEPRHGTGTIFLEPEEVAPGIYVDLHLSAKEIVRCTQRLLEHLGVPLEGVRLRLGE